MNLKVSNYKPIVNTLKKLTFRPPYGQQKEFLQRGVRDMRIIKKINSERHFEQLIELFQTRLDWLNQIIPIPLFPGEKQHFEGIAELATGAANSGIKDGLTQIYNRSYFDVCLKELWSLNKRKSKDNKVDTISLFLMDIDFFKPYNDLYGHLRGDNILRKVAQIIQETLERESDVLARYGGEEFVIILPSTNEDGAVTVAKKIHEAILAEQIPHVGSEVSNCLTLSIGISTLNPNEIDNKLIERLNYLKGSRDDPSTNLQFINNHAQERLLVLSSDIALYAAKNLGRSQSMIFSEVPYCKEKMIQISH
ncbi:MAG: GGDEF domain-containing protein [Candidatus Caenarcaniphilales bacterium]|nr:GGDEF domain-containing protein [Candidatus Caenarcaniphilales bacterium]